VISPELLPPQLTGKHLLRRSARSPPDASLFDIMEEIERRIISDRLERCNWNQTDAASTSKSRSAPSTRKIKRLSIEVREAPPE